MQLMIRIDKLMSSSPDSYASPPRKVYHQLPANSKPPLFILLDGTWTEARKMFRKGPTLMHYHCFQLMKPVNVTTCSVKRQEKSNIVPLEVAASILANVGDDLASQQLFLILVAFVNNI